MLKQVLQAAGVLADESAGTAVQVVTGISYQRLFAGGATPFPSESLVAPFFGYTIRLSSVGEQIGTITESDWTLSRGFWGN